MTSLPLHPVPSALTNLDPARLQKANHLQRQVGCCCPQILLDSKLQHQEEPSKSSEARELFGLLRVFSVVHCRPLETPTPIRGEGSRPSALFQGELEALQQTETQTPRLQTRRDSSMGPLQRRIPPLHERQDHPHRVNPRTRPTRCSPPDWIRCPPPARWPQVPRPPRPLLSPERTRLRRQRGETDSGDSAELMVEGWRAREACSCLRRCKSCTTSARSSL